MPDMDKPDVSSLLGQLEPTTEYAEFLTLWPDIKEARNRQVRLKAIYETLTENKLLSVSYVTFTRFVKKADDENTSDTVRTVRKKTAITDTSPPKAEMVQTETQQANDGGNSETSAAPARDALAEAKKTSSSKNYARNVRRGQ